MPKTNRYGESTNGVKPAMPSPPPIVFKPEPEVKLDEPGVKDVPVRTTRLTRKS